MMVSSISPRRFVIFLLSVILAVSMIVWFGLWRTVPTRYDRVATISATETLTGFSFDASGRDWTKSAKGLDQSATVFSVSGQKVIYSRETIAFDPAHAYRLWVRLRVLPIAGNVIGSKTKVGLIALDEKGAPLSGGSNPHRFGVIREYVSANGEWRTYYGTFRGTGDDHPNKFPANTKKMRAAIAVNAAKNGRSDGQDFVTEIDWIRFERSASR